MRMSENNVWSLEFVKIKSDSTRFLSRDGRKKKRNEESVELSRNSSWLRCLKGGARPLPQHLPQHLSQQLLQHLLLHLLLHLLVASSRSCLRHHLDCASTAPWPKREWGSLSASIRETKRLKSVLDPVTVATVALWNNEWVQIRSLLPIKGVHFEPKDTNDIVHLL